MQYNDMRRAIDQTVLSMANR